MRGSKHIGANSEAGGSEMTFNPSTEEAQEVDSYMERLDDEQVEAMALGTVLISDGGTWEHVGPLPLDAFIVPKTRAVFRAMRALFNDGMGFDEASLCGELRQRGELDLVGGWTGISEFASSKTCPTSANAPGYVRELFRRYCLRRYQEALERERLTPGTPEDREIVIAGPSPPTTFVFDSLDDIREAGKQPIEWVFENQIEKGQVAFLLAPGTTGKSFFAFQLGLSAVLGRRLLDDFDPPKPLKCSIIMAEDKAKRVWERMDAICNYFGEDESTLTADRLHIKCGKPAYLVEMDHGNQVPSPTYIQILQHARTWKPDLIILDPLSHFFRGDENSNSEGTGFINLLKEVAEQANAAILITHHTAKGANADKGRYGRGASAFEDGSRYTINLREITDAERDKFRLPSTSKHVAYLIPKNSYAERSGKIRYLARSAAGVLFDCDLATEFLREAGKAFAERLRESEEEVTKRDATRIEGYCAVIQKELKDEGFDVPRKEWQAMLNLAIQAGILKEISEGRKKLLRAS